MHIVGTVDKAVATYNPTITQFEKLVRHTFGPSVALLLYALLGMCITLMGHIDVAFLYFKEGLYFLFLSARLLPSERI